jgi:3-phytase
MVRGRHLWVVAVAAAVVAGCGDDVNSRPLSGGVGEGRSGGAVAAQGAVAAVVETEPVPSADDAADDPAIWVDEEQPARSAVIGTDKDAGIAVYDLEGRELQYRRDGELNNVDLRSGFSLGGDETTLVAAGNQSDNSIALYRFDRRTRTLEDVAARRIEVGIATYGSCMYRSPETGRFYYFVNSKQGQVEQWELIADGDRVDARRVRELSLGSQTEGCVADDDLGRLYVGEEQVGIWRFDAEPGGDVDPTEVDTTGDGGHLTADVEGLAIAYDGGEGDGGYLVASSQGDNSFALYRREGSNDYVGSFAIGDGEVDGVEETDGLDVTSADLGGRFSGGLLVVQDGSNGGANQNYKLVAWDDVVGPDGPTAAVSPEVALAVSEDEEPSPPSSAAERVGGRTVATAVGEAVEAARDAVPGEVVEAELDDPDEGSNWSVEIVRDDGSRIELTIDSRDATVLREAPDDDGVPEGMGQSSVEEAVDAAVEAVPGEVIQAELDDDYPSAWKVEVLLDDGSVTELLIDIGDLSVVREQPGD